MEYSAGTSWLHSQHVSDLHDTRTTTNDDWKESTSAMSQGAGPSGAQQSMALSDFALDPMAGEPVHRNPSQTSSILPSSFNSTLASAASSSVNTPASSYYYSPPSSYFLSGDPVTSYTPSATYRGLGWPSPPTQIPLSNYSSLNGATSVSQSAPVQVHQASSPPQMMIDPQLTVNSPPASQQQHFSVPFLSSQPQQRTHYSYQHPSHPTSSSISSPYLLPAPTHYQLQRQPSQQASPPPLQPLSQGTLAPYALHSPSLSAPPPSVTLSASAGPSSIPATTFYASPQPPVSSGPTPEQLKEKFVAGIRPLIQPSSFTGAGAVNKLTTHIDDYGASKVDASTRTEILTRVRDNAANHYFRAWQENELAMDITKTWLKESADPDSLFTTTTMPILHILDRLPMTFQCLKSSLIARELKPFKAATSAAIQDMASNLTRKWRALLPQSQSKTPAAEGSAEDSKNKKRKAEEMASTSKVAPAKKIVVAASTAKPAPSVKKEVKSTVKEPTTAKSDSSFFSKPKPRLPSFNKKSLAVVKKEPDLNVAQPSSYNPFMEIVASMKPRKDSPSISTPPPTAPALTAAPSTTSRQASAEGASTDKKKKSVTWAPDGQLEVVKLIERAVYDDDPADGMHTAHSVRDLDRSEGATLIAHLFDEQVDWSEPLLIDIPSAIEVPARGKDSVERVKQEEREQTALSALYLAPADLPDTPSEPDFYIPEEQVDAEAKVMLTGSEVDSVFWSGGAPAALSMEPPPTSASVAELVGQLSSTGSTDVPMGNTQQSLNFDPALLAKIGPDLQQLVQQAQAFQQNSPSIYPAGQSAAQVPRGGGEQEWNSAPYPDYDRGYDEAGRRWSGDESWNERGGVRGRGLNRGRGRGRGDTHGFGRGHFGNNKRKPCSFFAQGRCKYGDQCDFSHELGGAVSY